MAIGEVILHIGMHKTGSTSIQNGLDGYDDGRIAYANLKVTGDASPNHGHAIETVFRKDFENTPVHQRFGRTKAQVEGYRGAYRKNLMTALGQDRERLILSGEAMPRLRRGELADLHALLREHARSVRVIAYVREPYGFIASMFQQQCRLGHIRPGQAMPAPKYRRKFRKFITVFGRNAVEFIKFDREDMKDGSSLQDFAHRVGINDLPQEKASNQRLSADATRFLYILLTQHADFCAQMNHAKPLSMTVGQLEISVTGDPFRLPSDAVGAWLDVDDIAWMERKAGFKLVGPTRRGTSAPFDLESYMNAISDTGIAQLHAALDSCGVAFGRDDAAERLIFALYLNFCKRSSLKVKMRRTIDQLFKIRGLLSHRSL